MIDPPRIPKAQSRLSDQSGIPTREWYNYFRSLLEAADGNPALEAQIQAILTRLEALENGGVNFQLLGLDSVVVYGTPANGFVRVTLEGDSSTQGNSWYYGSGPDGVKGWYAISDTLAADIGELTKSVDPVTGVTSFGLEAVANSGSGSLLAITRDGFGRVTGTKAATITGTTGNISIANGDAVSGLPTINLSTVADSGTGSILAFVKDTFGRVTGTKPATITGTATQINVANGNASAGLPTLSLAPEVLSALAEATSALQPSDVTGPDSVKVTSNGAGGIILRLDGDVTTPAALNVYSTNSAGTRGWYRPAIFESTGVIDGGALSINAGNAARFDMDQAVIGYTDWSVTPSQPTRVLLTVGPFSSQVVTNIATSNATYVGIQMPAGTIIQQTSPFSNAQRRSIAQIGVLVHSNNTVINAINSQAATIRAGVNQVGDVMKAIGHLNLSGNIYSANGANLNINKSAGTLFIMGGNFQTNNLDPHVVSNSAQTALTFRYRLSTGTEGADTTNINPNQYESSPGVLTNIPILGNQWHVQRINIFQSGLTRIQYGQQLYGSLAAALQGIQVDSFNTEQNIAENGVLRCYLVINRGLLGLLGSATFVSVSKFGATQAGGGIVPVHNDLSGLQGGTSGEYYHLTNAQYIGLAPWASISPASKADDSLVVHKAGTETISGRKTVTEPGVASQFLVKGDVGFNVNFILDKGVSNGFNTLLGRAVGVNRWAMLFGGNEPETGSNAGSDFVIQRYDDAGNVIARAITLKRSNGEVTPGVDNSQQFGTAPFRWSEIFAANGTINTSDAREKTPVRPLAAAELAAAVELAGAIGAYRWLAMIEAKGGAAREHIGMTVQRAIEILESHGLDAFSYGFICYDKWDELPEMRSEDGDAVQEYRPAADRYSFRMDELMAFIARGLSHRLSEVERRLDSAGL